MNLIATTARFYIGAATTGNGPNKWSWPGRDLPLLYEVKYRLNYQCSLDPDLETWKKFGLFTAESQEDGLTYIMSVKELVEQVGETAVLEMLQHGQSNYLSHSKDVVLDRLGCPHPVEPASPNKPAEVEAPPLKRDKGWY